MPVGDERQRAQAPGPADWRISLQLTHRFICGQCIAVHDDRRLAARDRAAPQEAVRDERLDEECERRAPRADEVVGAREQAEVSGRRLERVDAVLPLDRDCLRAKRALEELACTCIHRATELEVPKPGQT